MHVFAVLVGQSELGRSTGDGEGSRNILTAIRSLPILVLVVRPVAVRPAPHGERLGVESSVEFIQGIDVQENVPIVKGGKRCGLALPGVVQLVRRRPTGALGRDENDRLPLYQFNRGLHAGLHGLREDDLQLNLAGFGKLWWSNLRTGSLLGLRIDAAMIERLLHRAVTVLVLLDLDFPREGVIGRPANEVLEACGQLIRDRQNVSMRLDEAEYVHSFRVGRSHLDRERRHLADPGEIIVDRADRAARPRAVSARSIDPLVQSSNRDTDRLDDPVQHRLRHGRGVEDILVEHVQVNGAAQERQLGHTPRPHVLNRLRLRLARPAARAAVVVIAVNIGLVRRAATGRGLPEAGRVEIPVEIHAGKVVGVERGRPIRVIPHVLANKPSVSYAVSVRLPVLIMVELTELESIHIHHGHDPNLGLLQESRAGVMLGNQPRRKPRCHLWAVPFAWMDARRNQHLRLASRAVDILARLIRRRDSIGFNTLPTTSCSDVESLTQGRR